MLMIINVCLDKRHQKNIKVVADDAVDPDLEDEILRAMCSIRKEFGKSVKIYCEEEFLYVFNTSPIGRALTKDATKKMLEQLVI